MILPPFCARCIARRCLTNARQCYRGSSETDRSAYVRRRIPLETARRKRLGLAFSAQSGSPPACRGAGRRKKGRQTS